MLIEPASGEYNDINISINFLRNWKMVLTYHGCDQEILTLGLNYKSDQSDVFCREGLWEGGPLE